ncbi:uncharacterized protein [Montipora foliosa]|uniref:uncharacterized protein n=1 Tax=Montipora foliosa TaxID=591990 RepID=UPI0035F1DFF6
MSTSWQYGDVSPARYPFREEEEEEEEEEDKKAPVKQKRKENQDVAREAAEPPVKIYKEARQKAAEKRKEKKKEQETKLNEAACELDGFLASVPSLNELPSYEEMVVMEQLPSLEHESPTDGHELRRLKVEKRRRERKWQCSGLEIHKQMYKEIADRYYSAIEHSKRLYYHEKVSDCNQKQLFKFIDGLFKAKSSSPLPAHVSPFELAQRFSEYFSSKIVALHSDIDNITSQPVGTETALLRVFNDINLALDQHNEVILVLLDLSSTFDTIDHTILSHRLESRFGLNGTVLKWFKSYLVNRTQSIVIDHTVSTPSSLMYGVPQGSVLGPLLFSLYVSPLEDIVNAHNLQTMMYADDTQLYLITQNSRRSSGLETLEHCANDIIQWMKDNKLLCNTSKTEVLHFTSRFLDVDSIIGNSVKELTSEARDLGVILDHHLKMSSHINNICKSASYSLRRIGQIRRYLNTASTEKLVHASITSKLDYCNSLIYGLPDKDLIKLQRIQNSAARLVTLTKKFEHVTSILQTLHWLPVKKRIVFKILLLTFKVLNGQAPSYLSDLLVVNRPVRALRSNSDNSTRLVTPLYRTETYGGRAFSSCAPRLWNQLPSALRSNMTIDVFKKQLKTFLFD